MAAGGADAQGDDVVYVGHWFFSRKGAKGQRRKGFHQVALVMLTGVVASDRVRVIRAVEPSTFLTVTVVPGYCTL